MDKIARIRQEIERHRQAIRVLTEHTAPEQMSKTCAIFQYSDSILSELLSFLDTISEEPDKGLDVTDFCKPIDPGIAQCVADHWLEMLDSKEPDKSLDEAAYKYSFDSRPSIYGQVDVIDAFKAGAEWQASQMPMPEDTVLFNKGVAEGRRLMMEDAVEADVNTYKDLVSSCGWAEFVVDMPSSETDKLGDKVRIVVLKEEDEK